MKKSNPQQLNPKKLASSATIIIATTSFFATNLALISPSINTITPILKTLYGPIGYNISLTGSLLGALYISIDTFILTYAFAWIYNKLL